MAQKPLFAGFAGSVRRAIRKARLCDLDVQISQSEEAMLEFYRLHARTRRRHGLPPQPVSFFLNIYNEIIKPGSGFVVLAKQGTISVAGAVFFHTGKKAVYKFGASDERHQDLRRNNLVMWEAITVSGATTALRHCIFGRTSLRKRGPETIQIVLGNDGGDRSIFPI